MNYIRRLWQAKGGEAKDFRPGVDDRYKPFFRGQLSNLDLGEPPIVEGRIVGGPMGGVVRFTKKS